QWSQSGTPSAVYVHLHSNRYDFTGCFKGASPTNVQLPENAWANAFAHSDGATDPVTVELSTMNGSTVSTVKETWKFAIGSLKGTLYYTTSTSQIAGNNGAVMLLKPGETQPTALLAITGVVPVGPCISCHSLSADGSMLVAQQHFYPGGLNP